MIVQYNDNDSYLSPVAPNNDTIVFNNGTVARKVGAVVCQIFVVAHSLFNMSNYPLHSFLAPKSLVLGHQSAITTPVVVSTGAQRVATGHPLQNQCNEANKDLNQAN